MKREERLEQNPNRDRQQTDGHAGRALSVTPMAEKSSETLCVESSALNEGLLPSTGLVLHWRAVKLNDSALHWCHCLRTLQSKQCEMKL